MLQNLVGGVVTPHAQFDRHDVRFVGAVAGRYALHGRRDTSVHFCRLFSISTRMAVVAAPVGASEGEVVTAYFDAFGVLRGKISRRMQSGFVLDLLLSDTQRNTLGDRIVWQRQHVQEQLPDKRAHKRILPRDPQSVLTLADGSRLPCTVVDVSPSGIAVSADIRPGLGTSMAVGKLVGRVVRHLELGFALRFAQLQPIDQLDRLMAPAAS